VTSGLIHPLSLYPKNSPTPIAMPPTFESDPRHGGKYLYAIALADARRDGALAGIDGRPVVAVSQGGVTAFVSDCRHERIRPERAHVTAHREVLKGLMREGTVLPMAFGIIADDLKAVRRMLTQNQEAFREQLERVAGKLEMGLRVTWDVPNIFDYFVGLHPELRAARDQVLGDQRAVRQDDKIELGRLFDRLLNEAREAHAEVLEEALAPCCAEIKRAVPRKLNEVANLNLLIERSDQYVLENTAIRVAAQFDNHFAFDLNGPWAPHNFVALELQLSRSS